MLRSIVEKQPGDPFPRYALAMELKSMADRAGAWQAFEALLATHPEYIPSYAPAGEVLVELEQTEAARGLLAKGIEVCARQGAAHAQSQLEEALAELNA